MTATTNAPPLATATRAGLMSPGDKAALAGQVTPGFQTLVSAATIAWNAQNGANAVVTLTGNAALGAIANPIQGRSYVLLVTQDGTGGRTLSFAAAYDFGAAGTPALTATAGKTDMLTALCVSSATPVFYASLTKGF